MSGRIKDIINRSGEKFSALDIESAIGSHPDVSAVAVTAVPDERLGEAVGAWIVLAPGAAWDGPGRLVRRRRPRAKRAGPRPRELVLSR